MFVSVSGVGVSSAAPAIFLYPSFDCTEEDTSEYVEEDNPLLFEPIVLGVVDDENARLGAQLPGWDEHYLKQVK